MLNPATYMAHVISKSNSDDKQKEPERRNNLRKDQRDRVVIPRQATKRKRQYCCLQARIDVCHQNGQPVEPTCPAHPYVRYWPTCLFGGVINEISSTPHIGCSQNVRELNDRSRCSYGQPEAFVEGHESSLAHQREDAGSTRK